ncbi:S-layer homology domain-containing protein [Desulfofalx alkaliphila]|uniref:S-layer homology domain-containing protein n=1 Tax=Desulfofalx alkaliphila TaxID=105483 RepID=UPI00146F9BCE|nr:S-layer homology domain-containing protein [Desulfofalx alkaliphila]
MKRRSALVVSLALCLVLAMTVTAFAKASDVADNHWAKEQIDDWLDKGLAAGYEDGSFKPNKSVSRAEFVAFVNRAHGLTESAEISFPDVDADAWYAEQVAIAKEAGYIGGYEDGTFKPNANISRQEAASMLARLVGLDEESNVEAIDRFADAQSIPAWSKGAVAAVVAKGYMGGYEDETFRATRPISRAETLVTIDRTLNDVEEVKLAPTVRAEGLDIFDEGVEKEFSVTTAVYDYENTMVTVNLEISKEDAELTGDELAVFYEVVNEEITEYLELPLEVKEGKLLASFGPAEGFPLLDATDNFKATFAEGTAGEYTVTISIVAVEGQELLTSKDFAVTVNEVVAEEPVEEEVVEEDAVDENNDETGNENDNLDDGQDQSGEEENNEEDVEEVTANEEEESTETEEG